MKSIICICATVIALSQVSCVAPQYPQSAESMPKKAEKRPAVARPVQPGLWGQIDSILDTGDAALSRANRAKGLIGNGERLINH